MMVSPVVDLPDKGSLQYKIRPMVESDFAFIMDSWMKSAWSDIHRNQSDYYRAMTMRLTDLLPICRVEIAHNPEEPDQIFGWACGESRWDLLHYVFVKRPFRNQGIARALIGAVRIAPSSKPLCTHKPSKGKHPFHYIGVP